MVVGVSVTVGVGVTVGVAVGIAVGEVVGVGVGQGLAMIVTKRTKGSCTPSSITTSLMMGLSCGMIGEGPLQPKLMECVSPASSEPAQVMVSVSSL